jgi:Uma2 family endonuclease
MVATKLLTAEAFYELGLENAELIDGEVVETMRPTPEHGEISLNLGSLLRNWNKQHNAGRVGTDGGFIVGRNPDKVRGPDVWFVSNARVPDNTEKFWEVAPDLVAEIISPSDTANVIKSKLSDYFAAGTLLVWLVYPLFKQVEAHSADGKIVIFSETDRLEAPQILPGFSCQVSELFD